jgi:hypothetical protein
MHEPPLLAVMLVLAELSRCVPERDGGLGLTARRSIGVVTYLRTTEGPRGLRDLFGMPVMGTDFPAALSARLRNATLNSLDAAWRRFPAFHRLMQSFQPLVSVNGNLD